jgi:hypothetical protein
MISQQQLDHRLGEMAGNPSNGATPLGCRQCRQRPSPSPGEHLISHFI